MKTIPALATVLLLTASGLSAQVVYRENFTTPNNNVNGFTDFNWGSIGSNGTSNTTASGSTMVLQTSNAAGPQNTLVGVNNTGTFASPTNGAAGNGFSYLNTNSGFDRALIFTLTGVEYFGAGRTVSSSSLSEVSVQTGSSSSGQIRAAVLVDSTWYVTSTSLTAGTAANAAAFTGTPAQTQTWDSTVFAGANWVTLDTSVVGFALGGTAGLLPTGNVNAMGFYYTSTINTGTQRFDNFTVTVVPEPTSAVLALLGGVLVFRRRRTA